MAKKSPIVFRNRAYLFIKNVLKSRLIQLILFVFRFRQLKSSFLWKKNSSQLHFKTTIKNIFKFGKEKFSFSQWLLQRNSLQFTKATKTPKKSVEKTPFQSSLLCGWGVKDIWQIFSAMTSRWSTAFSLPKFLPKKIMLPKFSFPKNKKRKKDKAWSIKFVSIHTPTFIEKLSKKLKKLTKINFPFRQLSFMSIILGILVLGWSGYVFIFKNLPSPQELTQSEQIITTRILSRDKQSLFKIYEDENRTLVSLQKIPQDLINATIAIEDKNFYYHHGFDIRGIIRAIIANSKSQNISQGGSTITQQLVKNRLLTHERTIQRKIRELVLSVMVETQFSKQEILEMYLNQVPYGGTAYGAQEASWQYFGKNVSELTLAESSFLAGLPQAPSVYSPFGATPELAKARQAEVLGRMVEDEYISQTQADVAYNQELAFRTNSVNIIAPHFVFYVKKLLAEQYGEEVVNQGGLQVTTTLDLAIQEKAQELVTTELKQLERMRVSNGAALVTNPKTGEILSMVGSKNYFDFAHDGQVNVTLRLRQPGSSIKPLTYALALEEGKTPSTIINDSPITYSSPGSPPYSPKNYDGKFHGKVTLRESLASSYNIPAVKTLAEIGVKKMLDRAPDMGIETWSDRSRFGLSLTLGGGEVRMFDMAELYSTFANKGKTVELNPILEVKNYKGEVLYRNTCALDNKGCPEKQNLSELVAYQISDILSDNKARTPAFGPRSVLYIPDQEVAVKTGTTNNLRDNWTIGYTSDYLVATWVGNNDNTPMSYVASGVTGASPIWNKIMRLLLSEEQPHQFPTPAGMIEVEICASTGTLPCRGCPRVSQELFIPGTEPTTYCSPSWFEKKESEEKE